MPNQGGTHEQHVKAGQQSHKKDYRGQHASGQQHERDSSPRGGSGNFAKDRERASQGHKGGKH